MLAVESGDAKVVAECLNNSCNPFVVNGLNEKAEDLARKFENSGSKNNVYKLIELAIQQWKE